MNGPHGPGSPRSSDAPGTPEETPKGTGFLRDAQPSRRGLGGFVDESRNFVLVFALIILPSLYFIGIVSFVRSVQVAIEDMVHARGMARIRHYFVERSPGVRSYLMHSPHDDYRGTLDSFGLRLTAFQSFMTTAGMVNVISVIAGVFVGLAIKATISLPPWAFTLGGVTGFVGSVFICWRYEVRAWTRAEQNLAILSPSEE